MLNKCCFSCYYYYYYYYYYAAKIGKRCEKTSKNPSNSLLCTRACVLHWVAFFLCETQSFACGSFWFWLLVFGVAGWWLVAHFVFVFVLIGGSFLVLGWWLMSSRSASFFLLQRYYLYFWPLHFFCFFWFLLRASI